MNKKIAINLYASLLIVTYSLMSIHELEASSVCPTNSIPSISPQELWEQGVNEGKLLKLEKSLKEGFRPFQQEINDAFKFLVQHKKRNIITWLLSSPYGILRPDQEGVNVAFQIAALNNLFDIMQWLLTQPSSLPLPDQDGVNGAFESSSSNNHRNIMEWLLTQPANIPLPDQEVVILIYRDLCASNHTPETENLLRVMDNFVLIEERILQGRGPIHPLTNQGIDMDGIRGSRSNSSISTTKINEELEQLWNKAVQGRNLEKVEEILMYGFKPNKMQLDILSAKMHEKMQTTSMSLILFPAESYNSEYIKEREKRIMNRALLILRATKNDYKNIMIYLLFHPTDNYLPQETNLINKIFLIAAENNNLDMMKWLLTRPAGISLPDEISITSVYRHLCANGNPTPEIENILRMMAPLVPLEERINQGRAPAEARHTGMAHEVHDYSNTRVPSSCDSGRTSPSENQRLFDAILNQIETRIQILPLIDNEMILPRLISAIEHVYAGNPEQIALATQALKRGYAQENAPDYLQKVMTFLDTLPPSAFDLWFKGFIEESITAYINAQYKTSCTKGIKERILTGLRGIDPGLDRIFQHAEAPLLMKQYINKQFNIYDESVQRSIATMLKEKGIHAGSAVADSQSVLQEDLMKKLSQYGVEIPADIQESVRVIIEVFGDIYDEKIKPLL